MIESIHMLIEVFVSETKENGIGMLLLFGFWGTCVVMFYSTLVYCIYSYIKFQIQKYRMSWKKG